MALPADECFRNVHDGDSFQARKFLLFIFMEANPQTLAAGTLWMQVASSILIFSGSENASQPVSPFKNLKLASQEFLLAYSDRIQCPQCNRKRKYAFINGIMGIWYEYFFKTFFFSSCDFLGFLTFFCYKSSFFLTSWWCRYFCYNCFIPLGDVSKVPQLTLPLHVGRHNCPCCCTCTYIFVISDMYAPSFPDSLY